MTDCSVISTLIFSIENFCLANSIMSVIIIMTIANLEFDRFVESQSCMSSEIKFGEICHTAKLNSIP